MSSIAPVTHNNELSDRLNYYRQIVDKAKLQKRIFFIHPLSIVHFESIRKALKSRGWLEKFTFVQSAKLRNLSNEKLLHHAKEGNTYEAILFSRLMTQCAPNFIWQTIFNADLYTHVTPLRSRIRHFAHLDFTTKEGLARCARIKHWHTIEGVAELTTPRCYVVQNSVDKKAFMDNFRRTACISLLLFITENGDDAFTNEEQDDGVAGTCIEFAIDRVKEAIQFKCNVCIDSDMCPSSIEGNEWGHFFDTYLEVVLKKASKFKITTQIKYQKMRILDLMNDVLTIWPNVKMDGVYNTWIVKPWNETCGNGIFLVNDYNKIEDFINNSNGRFIIQKYIERPFLIYKTKFDIRQHFILTMDPRSLNLWMYQSCYFRFSSQEYNLDSFNRTVHLTNHSVQKNLKNCLSRSPNLPEHNMWTFSQFCDYLQLIGKEHMWMDVIYPAMKRNFIAAVLCSQTMIKIEKHAFHVYGCDFMLSDDFEVVLLEINSAPNLSPSTEANAQFFPELLNDVVRVVIDRASNKSASTGQFEHIYTINVPKAAHADLEVIARSYPPPLQIEEHCKLSQHSTENLQRTLSIIAGSIHDYAPDACHHHPYVFRSKAVIGNIDDSSSEQSKDISTNDGSDDIDEHIKRISKKENIPRKIPQRSTQKKVKSTPNKDVPLVSDFSEMFDSISETKFTNSTDGTSFIAQNRLQTFASLTARRLKAFKAMKSSNSISPQQKQPTKQLKNKNVNFLDMRFSKPKPTKLQQNRLLPIRVSSLQVPLGKPLLSANNS